MLVPSFWPILGWSEGIGMRSQNTELRQGMVDGRYKMIIKDRGGEVEPQPQRLQLACKWFALAEAPVFDLPDGGVFTSPYHTFVPQHDMDGGW